MYTVAVIKHFKDAVNQWPIEEHFYNSYEQAKNLFNELSNYKVLGAAIDDYNAIYGYPFAILLIEENDEDESDYKILDYMFNELI